MMTIFDTFIGKAHFHWAKTYADKAPHWYVVRSEFANDKEFDEVVAFIRKNGKAEVFWGRTYIYYYHNGYKYWTMGNPINETTIINKAKA